MCGHRRAVASIALASALLLLTGCAHPDSVRTAPSTPTQHAALENLSDQIAFVRGSHVWRMRPDGSAPVQLTTEASGTDFSPAWSPDRMHIAFVHTADPDFNETSTLCIVPSSGGAVRSWPFGQVTSNPCYSPDGKRVALVESVNSPPDAKKEWQREKIVLFDLDSQATTQVYELKDLFAGGMSVSWSPDGSRLLLGESIQDEEDQRSGILDLRTRTLRWLKIPDAWESHWSPDGHTIVVSQDTQEHSAIALATVDGGIVRVLARGPGEDADSDHALGQASYSPDGSKIVYEKGMAIVTMRSDGTAKHTVVSNSGGAPAWSCR